MQIKKVDNPLISSEDAKEEKIGYAAKRAKEKIAEKAARAEWKKTDKFEKEQSPWSNWYRKKLIPALLNLSKIRKSLYNNNLFDLYIDRPSEKIICSDAQKRFRRIDGKCNDL